MRHALLPQETPIWKLLILGLLACDIKGESPRQDSNLRRFCRRSDEVQAPNV
jgi:hypothetical protein